MTSDPRHLTINSVETVIPSRAELDALEPLKLINRIPIDGNNPQSRMGNSCGLLTLKVNMAYAYNGNNPYTFINFYIVKQNVRNTVTDPFPKLGDILDIVSQNGQGGSIAPQVPITSFLKIDSSNNFTIVNSKTIVLVTQNIAGYEEFIIDLNVDSEYSKNKTPSIAPPPGEEEPLETPLTFAYYIYATANPENDDTTDTNVVLTYSFRLCYKA